IGTKTDAFLAPNASINASTSRAGTSTSTNSVSPRRPFSLARCECHTGHELHEDGSSCSVRNLSCHVPNLQMSAWVPRTVGRKRSVRVPRRVLARRRRENVSR
ncbi:hypothetical protein AAVH_37712, partial [Aphelenchoides avenae]